jgi:hypothetical protein
MRVFDLAWLLIEAENLGTGAAGPPDNEATGSRGWHGIRWRRPGRAMGREKERAGTIPGSPEKHSPRVRKA